MPEKKTKVKLGLKNLAMLPSYFGYIFVHLRQKLRLRPEIFVNLKPEPGPNPTRKARPDLQLRVAMSSVDFTTVSFPKSQAAVSTSMFSLSNLSNSSSESPAKILSTTLSDYTTKALSFL